MSETRTKIKVHGINGRSTELEALADTGATFTKIPESAASELELKVERELQAEIGDGSQISRKLCFARVEIEDITGIVPVVIGGEKERTVVGYTALEILSLKANPMTGKLEKAVAIE